jgi:hypothetical protein
MKRVRITKGQFAGVSGVIVGCSSTCRIYILGDDGSFYGAAKGAWEREKTPRNGRNCPQQAKVDIT